MRAVLATSQSAGVEFEHLDVGEFLDDGLEAARAALRAGVAESALGHHHVALAADGVHQRLSHRRSHPLIVGLEEAVNVDLIERCDQRIHVDDGGSGLDHFVDGRSERADAESLDGHEIPLLRRHVVDRRTLLGRAELAIEPSDLDVEELAPIFGGALSLGAPSCLQTGVRKGRLERLAGPIGLLCHIGSERRLDAHAAKQRGSAGRSANGAEEIAPVRRRSVFEVSHSFLPMLARNTTSTSPSLFYLSPVMRPPDCTNNRPSCSSCKVRNPGRRSDPAAVHGEVLRAALLSGVGGEKKDHVGDVLGHDARWQALRLRARSVGLGRQP